MNHISLRTITMLCFVVIMASILAFTTKPVTVYVKKPLKSIRQDFGRGFKVPVFDDDDQASSDQGDQQAADQSAAQNQSQDWTWGSFGSSVGTGAVAGAIGGAAGGAAAGALAGGVGAGPGAVAGAVAGTVAGAVGGAVRYAWTYFGGSVSFVNVYVLPERALDFSIKGKQNTPIAP